MDTWFPLDRGVPSLVHTGSRLRGELTEGDTVTSHTRSKNSPTLYESATGLAVIVIVATGLGTGEWNGNETRGLRTNT